MSRTLQGTAESPHPWLTTRHPISRDRTARQLRQTLRGRDQADHHDSEKWEDCRVGRDTSRSHQSRHRDSCQHAIQPLQQDLGEERGPVERRNHHQAAKERRPWGLQQLSMDHALVNARQDSQEGSVGEDEGDCRPQAPRPAGRLPTEQISCRPDRQNAHHRGTVTGLELPLYISFIDYQKAFDSVDRETMWKLLRHCGVPWRQSPSSGAPFRTWVAGLPTPASCLKVPRRRLEFGRGAGFHPSSSFWSSTWSWRPLQQVGKKVYSGQSGRS